MATIRSNGSMNRSFDGPSSVRRLIASPDIDRLHATNMALCLMNRARLQVLLDNSEQGLLLVNEALRYLLRAPNEKLQNQCNDLVRWITANCSTTSRDVLGSVGDNRHSVPYQATKILSNADEPADHMRASLRSDQTGLSSSSGSTFFNELLAEVEGGTAQGSINTSPLLPGGNLDNQNDRADQNVANASGSFYEQKDTLMEGDPADVHVKSATRHGTSPQTDFVPIGLFLEQQRNGTNELYRNRHTRRRVARYLRKTPEDPTNTDPSEICVSPPTSAKSFQSMDLHSRPRSSGLLRHASPPTVQDALNTASNTTSSARHHARRQSYTDLRSPVRVESEDQETDKHKAVTEPQPSFSQQASLPSRTESTTFPAQASMEETNKIIQGPTDALALPNLEPIRSPGSVTSSPTSSHSHHSLLPALLLPHSQQRRLSIPMAPLIVHPPKLPVRSSSNEPSSPSPLRSSMSSDDLD